MQDILHDVGKAGKDTAHATSKPAKETAHPSEEAAHKTGGGTEHVAKEGRKHDLIQAVEDRHGGELG